MTGTAPLDTLIECLREHDIPFNQDDLQYAIQSDSGSIIEDWITDNISRDTVLTKEELQLYSELQKSGQIEKLASAHDLSLTRPIYDEEIRHASEQLKKSTAAIEKQMATLKIQQEAASALCRQNAQNTEMRNAANEAQFRMWSSESARTVSAIEDLTQNLSYHLGELETQAKAGRGDFNQGAAALLREDDKLLQSLQKLTGELDVEGPQDQEQTAYIRDLCARLIKYTVEGVRARLDRIYLESLSLPPDESSRDTEDAEIDALREELESLYSEILPVSQMSVEQQYLEPALQALSAQGLNKTVQSEKALDYVSECLTYLTARLDKFKETATQFRSYQEVSSLVSATIKGELEKPMPEPAKGQGLSQRARSGTTTTARPKTPKTVSPVRQRTLPPRRRSSSTSVDDEITPEQQLFRNLGISLPVEPTSTDHTLVNYLLDSITDRRNKAKIQEQGLQSTLQHTIGNQVHDARLTLDLLRDALVGGSEKGSVRLGDNGVEGAIRELENEVTRVGELVEGVDLDPLRERDAQREAIVERWSR